ncbi:GNAT family N-acetyltransferase [Pontivivens ytuae]|uniref:GNAT family N-acetyltransferase n=1 Tax=Pontivivens ytuae TaxID=2789856 RepID=A0A7S9LRB8_9RHOB|nr:GNAT family N-acetyltransferase [Pontivivens ytuae]QPH53802.1 GNAT family N-acetyltransferase [Pontivivens ytuae]
MLRTATAADFPFIQDQQARPELEALVAADTIEALRGYIAGADTELLIWEEDGPAAFILLAGLRSGSRNTELRRIVVAEVGRGTGQKVLSALMERVFERGTHRLWLDVAADNPRARAAYAKAGFREEGLLKEAWARRTGDRADLVIMAILASEWRALATPAPPA